MNNPIAWFEIYVDDIERAKRFYSSVLDFGPADIMEKQTAPDGRSQD